MIPTIGSVLIRKGLMALAACATLTLAVAPSYGDFFVTENANAGTPASPLYRIRRVTPTGVVSTFTTTGLNRPLGITADNSGFLYVANQGSSLGGAFSSSITKYDGLGNAVANFALPTGPAPTIDASAPVGLVTGPDGFLYVCSTNTNVILRVNPMTGASTQFNTFVPPPLAVTPPIVPPDRANFYGMAFSPTGQLYVANYATNSIQIYNSDGSSPGAITHSSLDGPSGLTFDRFGNLYVSNYSKLAAPADTIVAFSPTNTFLGTIANDLAPPTGQNLAGPIGLLFDPGAPDTLLVANNFVNILGSGEILKLRVNYTGLSPTSTTFLSTFVSGLNGPAFIAVPEPGSLVLMGLGLVGLGGLGVYRRQRAKLVA